MFGSPETTTGGMALRFYASVRLDIRRIQSIKSGSDPIGNRVRITVKKNKVAPPFKTVEFDIMYNEGVSRTGDVLDLAVDADIVTKRGAFYSYDELRLAQGRENAKGYLAGNQEILYEIENKLREMHGLPTLDVPKVQETDKADGEEAETKDKTSAKAEPVAA